MSLIKISIKTRAKLALLSTTTVVNRGTNHVVEGTMDGFDAVARGLDNVVYAAHKKLIGGLIAVDQKQDAAQEVRNQEIVTLRVKLAERKTALANAAEQMERETEALMAKLAR